MTKAKGDPPFYLYTNRGYIYGPGCGDPAKAGQLVAWGTSLSGLPVRTVPAPK